MLKKPAPLVTFANAQPAASTLTVATAGLALGTGEKMRQKVFRLTPAQDRELKKYCGSSDITIQDMVLEGINMVLKSKGLPSI